MAKLKPDKASVDSPTLQQQASWLEFSAFSNICGPVAGVDEVGRGCLFGPVVAAAVILPNDALSALMAAKIKDSKKLSASSAYPVGCY